MCRYNMKFHILTITNAASYLITINSADPSGAHCPPPVDSAQFEWSLGSGQAAVVVASEASVAVFVADSEAAAVVVAVTAVGFVAVFAADSEAAAVIVAATAVDFVAAVAAAAGPVVEDAVGRWSAWAQSETYSDPTEFYKWRRCPGSQLAEVLCPEQDCEKNEWDLPIQR